MSRNRLEAFSDGVIAIILTIMVLELHPPDLATFAALGEMAPHLLFYLLSFTIVAIYWNNHHHLLHLVERVNGRVLWANLHLLFWLSLIPFVTAWMGRMDAAPITVATYSFVCFAAGIAYFLLARALVALHHRGSRLAKALGADWKGKGSILAYLAALALAVPARWIALAIHVVVALVWLLPDRRVERILGDEAGH